MRNIKSSQAPNIRLFFTAAQKSSSGKNKGGQGLQTFNRLIARPDE
jgi:hypothetical protein